MYRGYVWVPDRPFHNFRASRSGNPRHRLSSGTSGDGFWSIQIVKGSVGLDDRGPDNNIYWCEFSVACRTCRAVLSQIWEPRNHEISEFSEAHERRTTFFEAPKLWKGRSGYFAILSVGLHPDEHFHKKVGLVFCFWLVFNHVWKLI